jgi:hypothetical protein
MRGTTPNYTFDFGIPAGVPGGSLSYPGVVTDGNSGLNVSSGSVTAKMLGTLGYVTPQLWGSGSNNLVGFFGNTANCNGASKPCFAFVDSSYAYGDHYTPYTATGVNASMGASQAGTLDFRSGAMTYISHDPGPAPGINPNYFVNFLIGCNNTLFQNQFGGTGQETRGDHCLHMYSNFRSPGLNLGNDPVGPTGWSSSSSFYMNGQISTNGIHNPISFYNVKGGAGDFANYIYHYSMGGAVDGSGEGNGSLFIGNGEWSGTYTGTVSIGGGGAGATVIHTTCATDCGNQGDGRILLDMKAGAASGYMTAQTAPVGTFTPGTYTVTATVTPSTLWGTLNANVVTPTPVPLGTGSTLMTFVVNRLGGTGPAVGDLACFGGQYHEQAKLTSVSGTGPYTLQAKLRFAHEASSWVMTGGPCGTYIDYTANQSMSVTTGPASQLLRYPYEILGATDAHTLVYRVFSKGGGLGQSSGAMLPGTTSVSNMVNYGGRVTFSVGAIAQWQRYVGASIYIASSSDVGGTFVGACTGVTWNSLASTMSCMQASSIGQTAAGVTGTVAYGTTPNGNTNFNLWPGCMVWDVTNSATSPPTVDGTFACEENNAAWADNDPVEESHHYAAAFSSLKTNSVYDNPNAAYISGHLQTYYGAGVNGGNVQGGGSGFFDYLSNGNAASMYQAHGGSLTTPGGRYIVGLWNYFQSSQYAPDPSGSAVTYIGCPVSGCTDQNFTYSPIIMAGNGVNSSFQYRPYADEVGIISTAFHFYTAKLDGFTMADNLTFSNVAPPVNNGSATFGTDGTLVASTTYYYYLVSRNGAGFSLRSPEFQLTTGSGSTNRNHIQWKRVPGATVATYVCEGTSSNGETQLINVGLNQTSYEDIGTMPTGTCPGLTDSSYTGPVGAAFVKMTVPGTAFVNTVQPSASQAVNTTTTLPAATGTLALTAQIVAVRAGSWSISSATSVPVTFSPAFNVTPTSCAVTPTADPTAVGAIWYTSLTTSGFTVNVHTSGTIAGTYQCLVNATSPTRRGPPRHHPPNQQLPAPPRHHPPNQQLPAPPRRRPGGGRN